MNFEFYLEKLKNSKIFDKFMKENKDAYFCSSFVSLDNQIGNQIHIDYFLPRENKIASFHMENGGEKVLIDYYNEKPPEEVGDDFDFDFGEIEKFIGKEMENKDVHENIQKILLSVQSVKKKSHILVTVFISKMGLVRMRISLPDLKVSDFEKKSLFDMIKFMKKD